MSRCSQIDIWSLGAALLEIISGVPIWMQVESSVIKVNGETFKKAGLFAVPNRDLKSILRKQIEFLSDLPSSIK